MRFLFLLAETLLLPVRVPVEAKRFEVPKRQRSRGIRIGGGPPSGIPR